MSSALASAEGTRLAELEQTIERGLETFVEVGEALREIRDSRLYREQHGTFEDYCQDRWGMSRSYAHRTIEAAEVSAMLPIGNTPTSESQARELAPLREQPEQMAEAWVEATEQAHAEDRSVTAADVREAVEKRRPMGVHYTSGRDDWETPQDLFDALDAEFKFELDVCALEASAKCPTYFTPETDGLAQDWKKFRCWMNPPYGEVIGDWMKKATDEAAKGATVVCLVPARVDTGWWWDYCLFGEIRFLRGRLRFGGGSAGAPFPSAVVIFGPGFSPRVKWWER